MDKKMLMHSREEKDVEAGGALGSSLAYELNLEIPREQAKQFLQQMRVIELNSQQKYGPTGGNILSAVFYLAVAASAKKYVASEIRVSVEPELHYVFEVEPVDISIVPHPVIWLRAIFCDLCSKKEDLKRCKSSCLIAILPFLLIWIVLLLFSYIVLYVLVGLMAVLFLPCWCNQTTPNPNPFLVLSSTTGMISTTSGKTLVVVKRSRLIPEPRLCMDPPSAEIAFSKAQLMSPYPLKLLKSNRFETNSVFKTLNHWRSTVDDNNDEAAMG